MRRGERRTRTGLISGALVLACIACASAAQAAEYYVSPTGTVEGDGSKAKPWDLQTALAQSFKVRSSDLKVPPGAPDVIKPGDTIWLRGGTYQSEFISDLTGTVEQPIVVRGYPGERATIDGYAHHPLIVNGSCTIFRDLEVMSGNPQRQPTDELPYKRGMILVFGANNKFINLVMHDLMDGIAMWKVTSDMEIYGCLISYSGRIATPPVDPSEGYGVMTQNETGTKLISDNIIFSQLNGGIGAEGREKAPIRNYDIIGNIIFCNGLPSLVDRQFTNIRIFGGGATKDNIRLEDNCTYYPADEVPATNVLGAAADEAGKNLIVRNNYFAGGQPAVEVHNWSNVTFTGNTLYALDTDVRLGLLPDQKTTAYTWDKNTYYAGKLMYGKDVLDWAGWQKATGLDTNSAWVAGAPKGVAIFLRPNKYEAGRANLCIYNWDQKDAVDVDIAAAGLKKGQAFEVRDAQNFYGDPVVLAIYDGEPVRIPMTGMTVPKPVGNFPQPPHTPVEFGAFVILKASAAR